MAFGRHETFSLRYGWLSKGFQALISMKNYSIFESEDATVILGVGKNMVSSIKYWLRACRMINTIDNSPTELGEQLLSPGSGFDPYLEDEATIWLLHWLLVTNTEQATSWYWFFNRYHKPEFTGQELTTGLSDFVNNLVLGKKKPSLNTLKHDATLIPRMYTASKRNIKAPLEEALDSPFSLLKLVTQSANGRIYYSRPASKPDLPLGIIGFAACELFENKQTTAIPIEDFMYSKDNFPALGSVFRLTENALVSKLEKLVDFIPGVFQIRDTAGQHQLYMTKQVEPIKFINKHYSSHKECVV